MTVFEGLRTFPWIADPVKDRAGMTKTCSQAMTVLKSFEIGETSRLIKDMK
jgi:hypothetical protein